MLVYGDAKRVEAVAAKVERLLGLLSRTVFLDPGIERHAAFAALLVEAGELEQGLLDEQLQRSGEERPTPLSEAAGRLTRAAADLFESSYRSCGSRPAEIVEGTAPVVLALEEILELPLSGEVSVTVPEGYAFYGLYPETYLEAARRAVELEEGPVQVIGIRSIGTSLAAAVAAGVGDGATTVTVRPGGHPFSRTLAMGEEMERRLLSRPGEVRFAVADEGPGLSGSSFGSVADWLEERGVLPDSISFFPSHRGGPGPYASERHRERWERARRHTVDFEELFVAPGASWPLASWVADLTGSAEGPLEDVSAGRWRQRLFPGPGSRPPAHLQQERRKYLLTAGGRKWLLKFVGLGRYGREALDLARTLESKGLVPPVAGFRHGFLVGPWLADEDGARPLPLVPDLDRAALLEQVATYLAFRAARLPAGPERRGAAPGKLLEMARFNTGKALGPEAAERLDAWEERLPDLAARERPILSDNRLHAWEWLVLPGGRILKADALDHHRSNDLVGEQDVAWDQAGAAIELNLSEEEGERLREEVARRSGVVSTTDQVRFYTLTYLAFQLGACRLAAEALEGMDG
ncbi:MAG TPA: hypothetical protein VEL74_22045, partial [Thermoanaerobaculia bacterium]|nr:hypothetical protein [Thermoanaerobaculia bacterium]